MSPRPCATPGSVCDGEQYPSSSTPTASPTGSSMITSVPAGPVVGSRKLRRAAMPTTSWCFSTSSSSGRSTGGMHPPPLSVMSAPGVYTGRTTSDASAMPRGSVRLRRSARSTRGRPHVASGLRSHRASTAPDGASRIPAAHIREANRSSGSPARRSLSGRTSGCADTCPTDRSTRAIGIVLVSATAHSCERHMARACELRNLAASSSASSGRPPLLARMPRSNLAMASQKVVRDDVSGPPPRPLRLFTLTSVLIDVSRSQLPVVVVRTTISPTFS